MIVKGVIESMLKSLNRRYYSESIPGDQVYFSKLAILELCGWIEASVDDLARRSKKTIRTSVNIEYLEDVIRRNYGFSYDRHFRHLISVGIGVVAFDQIETKLDPVVLAQFKSQLHALKKARDVLAHTFVKGQTTTIDAPSTTASRLDPIYKGLKAFEKELIAINK
jgi:hypothetical protein